MSSFVLGDNGVVVTDDRLRQLLSRETTHKLAPSEQLWVVPDSYYADWRPWFGRTHRNSMAQCFTTGDLLVIGPSFHPTMNSSRYLGRACLFIEACEATVKALWGEYSMILGPWGKEIRVRSRNLVPIELCERATAETWFKQCMRLSKP